jgi:aliphatic glucosinolate S-oxygenase
MNDAPSDPTLITLPAYDHDAIAHLRPYGIPVSGAPPAMQASKRTPGKPYSVAVIGAGPAGIVTMKEFVSHGHRVMCFEVRHGAMLCVRDAFVAVGWGSNASLVAVRQATPTIGGVFARHYERCQLVSNNLITAFSDFTFGDKANAEDRDGKDKIHFWYFTEYLDYLERYLAYHQLKPLIRFETVVTDVRQDGSTGKWLVTTRPNLKHVATAFELEGSEAGGEAGVLGEPTVHEFDRVVVCSGQHQRPDKIAIPGLDGFTGQVLHHFDIRDKDVFEGEADCQAACRVLALPHAVCSLLSQAR